MHGVWFGRVVSGMWLGCWRGGDACGMGGVRFGFEASVDCVWVGESGSGYVGFDPGFGH